MKYVVTRKTVSAFSAVVEAADGAAALKTFNDEGYAAATTENFSKSETLVREYTSDEDAKKLAQDAAS